MGMLRSSLLATLVSCPLWGAALPAMAQWRQHPFGNNSGYYPGSGASTTVIVGDRVYGGSADSIYINNRPWGQSFDRSFDRRFPGNYQPSGTRVIIVPAYPVYGEPSCSTSVAGSPIPLPYARNSATGLPCPHR